MSLPPTPALRLGAPTPRSSGPGAQPEVSPLSPRLPGRERRLVDAPASSSPGAPRLRAALSPLRPRSPSDGERGGVPRSSPETRSSLPARSDPRGSMVLYSSGALIFGRLQSGAQAAHE
ncbi:translation initiation factor IF-2-like [Gallus gallus]|uniref:translation initiation factor IF-2-like n=1 Tax=Gallus gallus TaxID=9031 RepID=UPI001F01BE82|nr:translation initiation factor IF-2-like [Gallus gallus]